MVHVPLKLWDRPRWELRGATDAESFFRHVGAYLPAATAIYVEGTSFSPEVAESFRRISESDPYLPDRQTTWPSPTQYRLPFTAIVLRELERLASYHAPPEVADHVFLYQNDAPLIEWPDAFMPDAPMHIAASLTREAVEALAKQLEASVTWLGEAGGAATR